MNGWVNADILNLLICILKKSNEQSIDISNLESKIDEILSYFPITTSSGYIFLGDWLSDQSYEINQTVLYEDKIYLCLEENSNIIPPSSNIYWKFQGDFNLTINGGSY